LRRRRRPAEKPTKETAGNLIRTLHMYISRELAKVTALALIAFTLVMTMFAVIEPLRKQGLAADQVLSLFAYTLPVMFSLTLPVAALFAATIVYGRFSQDNELLACRASGISTLSLLKPAMVLGTLVTLASLALSNFITPQMARMGELSVKANARGIVLSQLSRQGYFRYENHLIHADSIELVGDTLHLTGVVYADMEGGSQGGGGSRMEVGKGPKAPAASMPSSIQDVLFLVASGATVQFDTYEGDTYATVQFDYPSMTKTSDQFLVTETLQRPLEPMLVPSPFHEKAAFCDWNKLVQAAENPIEYREIANRLESLRQQISHDMFAQEVAKAINATGSYDRLSDRHETYRIKASSASVSGSSVALASGMAGGKAQLVEVTVLSDGKPRQVVTAESGVIKATWSAKLNLSQVTIDLRDKTGVLVRIPGERPDGAIRRTGWSVAQLTMPADLAAASKAISLSEIYRDPRQFTSNPAIISRWTNLQNRELSSFVGDIKGELHSRVAYSLSCFLLVAMGAALGLIYRGGQVVSAFAICVIPAVVVIVMIVMGKQLASNSGVLLKYGTKLGLAAIWGGIVALVAANLVIYIKLSRK
jgi:lipopolysaccharide export LptBFGC system permease protein LptF